MMLKHANKFNTYLHLSSFLASKQIRSEHLPKEYLSVKINANYNFKKSVQFMRYFMSETVYCPKFFFKLNFSTELAALNLLNAQLLI